MDPLRFLNWGRNAGAEEESGAPLFPVHPAALLQLHTIVFPSNFQEPRKMRLCEHYSGPSEETLWLNVLITNLLLMSGSSCMDQKKKRGIGEKSYLLRKALSAFLSIAYKNTAWLKSKAMS